MRLARSHGMSSLTWDRHRGHSLSYDVTRLGYNYRIDEMRAALGLVQLARLPRGQFPAPGAHPPLPGTAEERSWHHPAFCLAGRGFRLPSFPPGPAPPGTDRVAFMAALAAQGIQNQYSLPSYPSILLLPALVACRLRPQSPPNRGSRAQAGDPAAFSHHGRGAAG